MIKPKAIVALSGGMDSATVLARACLNREVLAVGFTYGSKHNPYENEMARKTADYWRVPFELLDLEAVMGAFKSDLLKTGGDIPEGHYEDSSMSRTVVPGRNIIFASILSGLAWSRGASEVWLGIHSGDHAIYPDCRPEFFNHMKNAILVGTDNWVMLVAPFLRANKIDIIRDGLELGVPYELTRTCYKDQPKACGKCGSCRERLEAFVANGIQDPVEYD